MLLARARNEDHLNPSRAKAVAKELAELKKFVININKQSANA